MINEAVKIAGYLFLLGHLEIQSGKILRTWDPCFLGHRMGVIARNNSQSQRLLPELSNLLLQQVQVVRKTIETLQNNILLLQQGKRIDSGESCPLQTFRQGKLSLLLAWREEFDTNNL